MTVVVWMREEYPLLLLHALPAHQDRYSNRGIATQL
jgi:hypothetical protein